MSIQSDHEIVGLLQATPPLLTDFYIPSDWYAQESLAQPASLDVHVGMVFVPPKDEPKAGELTDKRPEYTLEPGQAIVVDTVETLNFPSDIAAFGFPPTTISNRAILMTNPGHIDPGFKGKLSFTLINMGREPYSIKTGMIIATLLVIKLTSSPTKDFTQRNPAFRHAEPTNLELYRLGRDFLDLDQRTRKAAETIVRQENLQTSRLGILLTVLAAILGAALAFGGAWLQSGEAIAELKGKVSALENQATIESRLKDVETKVGSLSSNVNKNSNISNTNRSQTRRGKKRRGKKG
jgi:dCTP deaminase